MADKGLPSITPHEAIDLLRRILSGRPMAQVAAMHFDREAWIAARSPFLSGLPQVKQDAGAASNPALDLDSMTGEEALAALEKLLIEQTAAVVRMQPERIPRSTSFRSIGLDSLMGLELRNRLEARLSLRLPASTIWNYPTIEALTAHLAKLLQINRPDVGFVEGSDDEQPSLSAMLAAEIAEAEELLKWE